MPEVKIEGPFTSKEVERIYQTLMSSNFYDEDYNADRISAWPYDIMSDILLSVFALTPDTPVCDLGCGRGHLVISLAEKGINSRGIEFSSRVMDGIPEIERGRFEVVESLRKVDLSQTYLLTSMEVFEHLPMSIIVGNLTYMFECFSGYVFLTIPSSGKDRTLPQLGHVETDERRLAAMAHNVVCPYLVIEDGHVSGGHITLAGYRWWEDFFLTQGFARQTAHERTFGSFVPELAAKGLMWCCYILKALKPGDIAFGRGWYDSEGSFRWSGPEAEFQFISEYDWFNIECDFKLPEPNIAIAPYLTYFVEQVEIVDDYRMVSNVVAFGRVELDGADAGRHLDIPVRRRLKGVQAGRYAQQDGAVKTFTAYKVHFHTPLWRPSDYRDSHDDRLLGFCFEDVRISRSS